MDEKHYPIVNLLHSVLKKKRKRKDILSAAPPQPINFNRHFRNDEVQPRETWTQCRGGRETHASVETEDEQLSHDFPF